MQIKSNTLVKFVVPAVVLAGLVITMKSCSTPESGSESTAQSCALAGLSSEELRALGVEGDTPEDTLRTLVARLNQVRDNQKTLESQNAQLLKDNEQLRRRGTDVSGQVSEAVAGMQKTYDQKQRELQEQQRSLMSQIDVLRGQLSDQLTGSHTKLSDIPDGLGLDSGSGAGSLISQGADGLMWVSPADQSQDDPLSSGGKSGPRFPTSFLEDNPLTRQKAAYEQQVKGYSNEQQAATTQAVYTLPENSTLTGSRAMTALLGRVPVNGTVTDPYPFKILVGRDNLTANGIELPDVEGAVVSGTASGDWTLSCVRGQVNSITFVFADGTVRTLPQADVNGTTNSNQQAKNGNNAGGIGWISDEDGIPCISGTRKSNASTYLPTIFGLAAAGAAGDALSEGQYTSQNNVNGITSTLTGSAGEAALGKALSGGMNETADWVRQRYGQTFDAIYVPPGKTLAVHITRQLAIDYEERGRRVRYDFTLPGEAGDRGGLD